MIEDRWVAFAREALKDFGESRKSKDQDFCARAEGFNEPFDNNFVKRFGVLGRFSAFGGNRVGLMGSNDTDGSVRSSRTSLMVKEAWC